MPENESLRQEIEKMQKQIDRHDDRLDNLERFQVRIETKIEKIEEALLNINDDTKWLRRLLTQLSIGGVVTALVSLIVWLITG